MTMAMIMAFGLYLGHVFNHLIIGIVGGVFMSILYLFKMALKG